MNLSAPFVRRPIGTVLLTAGLALSGIAAFFSLPVSPLPQVDFPTVSVSANLPGASPETMASNVATPLERRLGTIADVTEMTSQSSTGQARVTLQFDLSRSIDGAARDVMAAINAARGDLPATLKSNPSYRKVNPADAPIMIVAMTSASRTPGQIYEAATNIVQQTLSQVDGVGDVEIGGGSLPAVRVEINPYALNRYGIGLEDVRAAISAANANRPKGVVEDGERALQIYTNDTGQSAADFRDLVVAWRDNAAVRLRDVARVIDSVEDVHTMGLFNGRPAVVAVISRQPGANIIRTVDGVRAALPTLKKQLPADIELSIASDRTNTIRASLDEVGATLAIALVLVILVVGAFLRSWRATLVPGVAVTVSILGAVAVMYLLGFSLNNLSLMALTIATGFVVDDAIVVVENTSRHLERGMDRFQAALLGAREVGFTVVSISLSLVAVFIPLLFMGGIVGRLFREFAVTLSAAVLISLLVSLTTTPMMCAWLLRPQAQEKPPGRVGAWLERSLERVRQTYGASLRWALAHTGTMLALLALTVVLNGYLFVKIPKGFFPEQDTGQMTGGLRADQSISFQAMQGKLKEIVDLVRRDPAVASVVGFTGGSRAGGGFVFLTLKPKPARKDSSEQVIARLRPQLMRISGATLFLNPVQDVRLGGRSSNSTYQYTLKSDNSGDLRVWADKLTAAMKQQPELTDVDSDTQPHGVESYVSIDRATASRLGIAPVDIDNALYDAFGQRQVSTIYKNLNQYHVIQEVDPAYARDPSALNDLYVPAHATPAVTQVQSGPTAAPVRGASQGNALTQSPRQMVPLSAIARFADAAAPTSINHQDAQLATTVSFNLAPGRSLSDAQDAIARAQAQIGLPANVHGSFQGTAKAFQDTAKSQPLLILAAIVAIYIVLGILYESLIHPLTVLSTLPSAGIGAVLALMLLRMEFSVIALIGLVLLIGIVKKNAILIIDFALDAERARGLDARKAIFEASMLRFRPILMTTLAAALGALPLAIGFGEGAELRQPLGVAIIGGLMASQVLTLLTTPVVYCCLDKLRRPGKNEAWLARAGDAGEAEQPA
ncbi:efflux RND transporter permease subunit [Lysobacter enzymogenes]|uniref:efflux RND transporter permease subunit n=1 Tax=Lysobacter enzymogenes TaxID=69 RepID=UPI001A9740FF|nr:efflux RND transporter permease subunit [Lysobacter enzymogenes]QQP97092.1 efflux RND transporter permease subunit [Lysobacter enzymogenes]